MFINSIFLSKGQRLLKVILGSLILATLAFIFVQSALSPKVAEAEASVASDIILDVVGEDSAVGNFADHNIDKIAHFTEFGLLGFFVSLYVVFFAKRLIVLAPLSMVFSTAVAVFDETIQIFSGRTPDTVDIMFDVLGFFIISLITYIVCFVIRMTKKKKGLFKW